MKQDLILLVGAGGHARASIDVIEQEGRYTIAGLVGLPDEVGTKVLDYSVLGVDDELPDLLDEYSHALVVVGQVFSPEQRMHLFNILKNSNFDLPTIVSPHAYVSRHARLGAGSIVMHGAIVNAGAVVGENCIINTNALIEHDVTVDDHCHVSTACTINGGAHVGAGTFVGSNSTVCHGVSIGEHCVIGMGQNIVSDCESHVQIPERNKHT